VFLEDDEQWRYRDTHAGRLDEDRIVYHVGPVKQLWMLSRLVYHLVTSLHKRFWCSNVKQSFIIDGWNESARAAEYRYCKLSRYSLYALVKSMTNLHFIYSDGLHFSFIRILINIAILSRFTNKLTILQENYHREQHIKIATEIIRIVRDMYKI